MVELKKFRDRRILYFIVISLILLLMFQPIGLPIDILPTSVAAFKYIDSLPAGSVVAIAGDLIPSGWAEINSLHVALIRHLLSKNVKFFYFTIVEEANMVLNRLKDKIDWSGKTYGVDYAFFGFIPGMESATAALARDIPTVLPYDRYGTPIGDIPMMKNIKSYKDINLLVLTCCTGVWEYYVRQWTQPFKVPTVILSDGGYWTSVLNWMKIGVVTAAFYSQRGAADYEQLINRPGDGIKLMDIQTVLHYLLISMIVIGNVDLFLSKRRKRK